MQGTMRVDRLFAYMASAIMVLVVFNVMAMPGTGNSERLPSEEASQSDTSDQGLSVGAGEDPILDPSELAPPVYDLDPGGSVDSFGGPPYSTFSETADAFAEPNLIQFNDTVSISTSSGGYVVNSAHPEALTLVDCYGNLLVKESYFTLKANDSVAVPGNGRIVKASSGLLSVQYDIIGPASNNTIVASMGVDVEFTGHTIPKITARVTDVCVDIGDWQIVWIISPSDGSKLITADNEEGLPLDQIADTQLLLSSLTVRVVDPSIRTFVVNWSDAEEGTLTAKRVQSLSGDEANVLEIAFGTKRAEIDPTLVATTSSTTPTELSTQRKVFRYGGYFWAFYYSGTTICYRKSADGIAWSSEYSLSDGTTIATDDNGYTTGFDVYERDGTVAIVWLYRSTIYPYLHLFFEKGTILGGKIVWSDRVEVDSPNCGSSPSVAIGTDGTFWIAALSRLAGPGNQQYYTWYSTTGSTWTSSLLQRSYVGAYPHWFVLMPCANGNMALLATWYSDGSTSDTYAYASWGNTEGWWTVLVKRGINAGTKGSVISAVGRFDGTINALFKENSNQRPCYVTITPSGNASYNLTTSAMSGYPSICLDENGDMHAYYLTVESGLYVIRHSLEWGTNINEWTTPDLFYTSSAGVTLKGLTSWVTPVGSNAMLWTENDNQVKFGSIPLPYGTPGAAAQPWNRDGISPYGTYFSSFKDLVSPGSGKLTLYQQDVSIEGRGTVDLEVSRIYQQPRYIRNADGQPYEPSKYPYCPLGQGWSLDLPWMDSQYVYVGGGQRFVIQWGNTGDPTKFENHDGVHFLLHGFNHGGLYYELIMSSGLRYLYYESTKKLFKIADSQGYTPANPLYAENFVSVEYDANGRLYTLSDQTNRHVTFSYNGYGNLQTVTRPDGKTFTYGYTSIGGTYRLTSVNDPMTPSRVTSFGYTAYGSPACYLLSSVTFPTGGRNVYTYTLDSSVGTEVRSYLVTSQRTEDSATSALIRQTDYDYKVTSGQVTFVKTTQKNETNAIQGYTDHIFTSSLKYTSEASRNSTGAQLRRTDTWYDSVGQPARVDTFEGSSQSPTYTEYASYDDWGNVIFTRDALGHESYASYENTKTQNSFQGGSTLTRSTSGKIFYDAYDDWDISDWSKVVDGGSVTLDGSADPPNAPAMKLQRTNPSGWLYAFHAFPAQADDMVVQASFSTSASGTGSAAHFYLCSGSTERLGFRAYNGNFQYYAGGVWTSFGMTYAVNLWYDLGFVLHCSTNSYEIYIDGVQKLAGAPLYNSGSIDTTKVYMNGLTGDTLWFDNLRIYKSLAVTVSLASGYVAELYDSKGEILDRSKTGNLDVAPLPLSFPPGYIKISKIGDQSYQTPMMDIWGGDVYAMSAGYSSTALPKTSLGYARYSERTADDAWPSGATDYNNGDLTWTNDADYAVSGSSYHESRNHADSHWHGYQGGTPTMRVYYTYVLIQYVWLPEGKLPNEIMVQYLIDGVWKRAYWGGDGSGNDIIDTGSLPPSLRLRVGDVPQVSGRWLQLTVAASDLGVSGTQYISGVLYGLYGGSARWDLTSDMSQGLYVYGLTTGQSVELTFDSGEVITASAGNPAILFPYGTGVRVFPQSGSFRILSGSTLLYQSPWMAEIWNIDYFTYYAPKYYANTVNWLIHDRQIASFEYQDYAKTVAQEKYVRYDEYGNAIQTKSSLGAGWTYTQAGYDQYGHMIWSTDETGRATFTEYSVADYRTYPASTRQGWRMDTFDTDDSWSSSSDRAWMGATNSSARSTSPDRSIKASFSGAQPDGQDHGIAKSWKEYEHSNPVEEISVSLYLESWYHNGGSPYEIMDTGIRMRLYDAVGTNYATYSYWLACWSGTSNNRSAPDQYTRVVYGVGDLPTGSWKNILLYPSTDWPSIDWDSCSEVRFELYVTTSWAYLDYLNIFYDNFVHNDFAKESKMLYSYNKPTGNLLSSTDPLGYTTSQQYDAIGRVVRANNSDSSYRTIVYSDTNNNVTFFDELGHKTITYFDKIGRVVKVERWGDGTSAYSWTTSGYNWQDQVSTHADEMGHVTKYAYDCLGRQTRETNPDLSYTTVAYDDVSRLVTSCSYSSGGVLTHKAVMVRDVLGRLNATREYTTSTNCNETLMTHDAIGNLLTVRDPKVQVTRMTYDSLNRVTRTTYPDSLYESATYDAAGRTLTKTDREGNATTSLYDSAGNLVKTVSPAGTVSRLYDAVGQLSCVWNNSAGASQGATWYYYNGRGWVTTQYDLIAGTWYTTTFGYDIEGRQTYVWFLPFLQFDYAYDGYDRVSTVRKHSDSSLLMTVTYNKDDTIASETTGDGTKVTTYSYNSRDWVSSMVMRLSGNIKLVLQYDYDDVGNVRQLVVNTTGNPNQAKTETYTYDWLDGLRSASGGNLPSGLTYAYDAAGNAVTFAGKTCTYGSYNKLTGDGTWTYTYDDNGNLAWKTKSNEKWNYQFNAQDQLTKVVKGTKSGQTWTYTTQGEYWYGPNGMMVKSLQGGTTTYYVYRGHDPLMEKTGSTSTYYGYVNGRMFAKVVGTTTYYYIRDALGSTRQVWQHGQTSATFSVSTYKPFGTPVSPSDTEKFEYAGEMIVPAAGTSPGLYYIGARWMDPELGRWLSLDPELGRLSSPQTMNRYVYCGNNPLRFVDPTGHRGHSGGHGTTVQAPIGKPGLWIDYVLENLNDFATDVWMECTSGTTIIRTNAPGLETIVIPYVKWLELKAAGLAYAGVVQYYDFLADSVRLAEILGESATVLILEGWMTQVEWELGISGTLAENYEEHGYTFLRAAYSLMPVARAGSSPAMAAYGAVYGMGSAIGGPGPSRVC